MSRILVVDDEQHIADGLRFNLEAEGHDVAVSSTASDALELLLRGDDAFDVVILDVMLPGKDGFETAAELRAAGQYVPILMLTARGRPDDVLRGFEAGADDYLPKPFELAILLARVNGLLRRRRWNERDTPPADDAGADCYTFAGRVLDFGAMEMRALRPVVPADADGERPAALSRAASGAGRLARRDPRERVGPARSTDTRAIDNFIVRLRRYIEDSRLHRASS